MTGWSASSRPSRLHELRLFGRRTRAEQTPAAGEADPWTSPGRVAVAAAAPDPSCPGLAAAAGGGGGLRRRAPSTSRPDGCGSMTMVGSRRTTKAVAESTKMASPGQLRSIRPKPRARSSRLSRSRASSSRRSSWSRPWAARRGLPTPRARRRIPSTSRAWSSRRSSRPRPMKPARVTAGTHPPREAPSFASVAAPRPAASRRAGAGAARTPKESACGYRGPRPMAGALRL